METNGITFFLSIVAIIGYKNSVFNEWKEAIARIILAFKVMPDRQFLVTGTNTDKKMEINDESATF